jgi:LacI family transcriptional regulator
MPARENQSPPPRTPKPTTAIDLARELGVSIATVSFVLNGLAKKNKISDQTAARVLEAAERHKYVPNQAARNLQRSRSGMISVILGNFKLDWAEAALQGIHEVLDATDYVPFVAMHGFDAARNRKELLSSLQRHDEGVIAFPMPDCDEVYRRMALSGRPLLFLGDEMEGLEEVSAVVWDSEPAAEAVVRHLVEIGRKRIAFFGCSYPGVAPARRFDAYRRVLGEHGLAFREEWVAFPESSLDPEEMTRLAMHQFFSRSKNRPDAIFAVCDGLALPALEYLHDAGFAVPADVAVAGMQDLPLASHSAIGLTTVREPVREMGKLAAQCLLGLMSGELQAPVRHVIRSAEVLIRQTTSGRFRPRLAQ